MRRWTTLVSLAMILPAFLVAPLLHVHGEGSRGHDDLTAHGHEAVVHAHIPPSPGASKTVTELGHSGSDHDGKLLTLSACSASVPARGLAVPYAEVPRPHRPPTPPSSRLLAATAPSPHPPPEPGSFSFRAPPA